MSDDLLTTVKAALEKANSVDSMVAIYGCGEVFGWLRALVAEIDRLRYLEIREVPKKNAGR